MLKITVEDVAKAKKAFNKNIVKHTPFDFSPSLSKKYGAKIYLKREDLQLVRSYKVRGAFNFINSLSKEEKKKGVVCASAGNHAQGIALSCKELGVSGTIFMPQTTPSQKVRNTKKFGGSSIEIKLSGDTFDEAYQASLDFCKETGAIFVHPFDDEKVITGQATVGFEILEEDFKEGKIDQVIVPVGGGGVISGIASIFSHLSPETEIIGVESENSASMKASLEAGKITTLEEIDTFCDGVAVKTPGKNTFEICKNLVPRVEKVADGQVAATLLDLLDEQGIIVEPAGALSIAFLEQMKNEIKGKNVVCIVSGGNFDFARLSSVKEKSLRFLGLKKYLVVSFPQRPGALREFLDTFGEGDDIVYFEYIKKTTKESGPAIVGVQSENAKSSEEFIKRLSKSGIKFEDITNNEVYFDLLI